MTIFVSPNTKLTVMKHLSKEQRYAISLMYKENKTQTEIAKSIGVSKSTICRELKRNMRPHGKVYNCSEAHLVSQKRWRNAKKHVRLDEGMKALIRNKLTLFWSPEQIAGYCRSQGIDCVSHERIYQMVWQDKKDGGTLYQQLRRRGRKHRKRSSKYLYGGTIPNRVDISERPPVVDDKARFGDLEGDLVIGKGQQGAIVTIVDRMTNFSWTAMLPGKKAGDVSSAIVEMLRPLKGYLHTLTFDNGREFSGHETLAKELGIKVYFARPYHSWERGCNENWNGLLRQFFPKGSSFEGVALEKPPICTYLINGRPRKKLGYLSPISKICSIFANDTDLVNLVNSVAFVG